MEFRSRPRPSPSRQRSFLAAREITHLAERGNEEIGPGDVAAAINGYRAVFDHLVTTRAASDPDLHEADDEP